MVFSAKKRVFAPSDSKSGFTAKHKTQKNLSRMKISREIFCYEKIEQQPSLYLEVSKPLLCRQDVGIAVRVFSRHLESEA